LTFRLPHGDVANYDIKDQGAVACVLALTPENKVILAQQFRPGPEQLLLEMPGGCVDAGEAVEAAIRRELLEETGYTGSFHYAFVGVQRSAEKRPDDQHRRWLYVSRCIGIIVGRFVKVIEATAVRPPAQHRSLSPHSVQCKF
jgi:8-oxo-dGTP pyrophosphatase MutT (NUDIX family)